MIDKIFNFFTKKEQIKPAEDPSVAKAKKRAEELQVISDHIASINRLSKNLVWTKDIVQRIVLYANILIESNPTQDTLDFLLRYLPHARRIVEEHVRYRLQDMNDLKFFWNLIQSKGILIRLANAFSDLCDQMGSRERDEFSAELSALSSVLKMRGY